MFEAQSFGQNEQSVAKHFGKRRGKLDISAAAGICAYSTYFDQSQSRLFIQHRANFGRELIKRKWLAQEMDICVQHATMYHSVGSISSGVEHFEIGSELRGFVG